MVVPTDGGIHFVVRDAGCGCGNTVCATTMWCVQGARATWLAAVLFLAARTTDHRPQTTDRRLQKIRIVTNKRGRQRAGDWGQAGRLAGNLGGQEGQEWQEWH